MIIDEATLRKLTRLTLVASQVRAGMMKGDRRSSKRGTSIEFADYRDYTPGDDLRRLDWNAYARLDRPFVKLFEEEEDLAVHILLDCSLSMDWGEGDSNKFLYAQRMAAALGAIALSSGDQLTLTCLQAGGTHESFGPKRGQLNLLQLFQFIQRQKTAGETDLNRSLRQYLMAARRPGLAILISDLFSPSGYREGLTHLQSRGFEITLLHLLEPAELDPPLAGDLRLVDLETGQIQEVSIDGSMRDLYRRRVLDWQAEIRTASAQRGIRYLDLTTELPWDQAIQAQLWKAGLLR
jgi:uncharacterized protein (DUF58 family)